VEDSAVRLTTNVVNCDPDTVRIGMPVRVVFEQAGDVYDIPVTVAVTYADGKTSEFMVIVDQAMKEARMALTGTLRSAEPNPDGASIAIFERK